MPIGLSGKPRAESGSCARRYCVRCPWCRTASGVSAGRPRAASFSASERTRDGGHGEDDQRHGERLAVVDGGADVCARVELSVRYFGFRWSRLMPSTHSCFDGNEQDGFEFGGEQFRERGSKGAGAEDGGGGDGRCMRLRRGEKWMRSRNGNSGDVRADSEVMRFFLRSGFPCRRAAAGYWSGVSRRRARR